MRMRLGGKGTTRSWRQGDIPYAYQTGLELALFIDSATHPPTMKLGRGWLRERAGVVGGKEATREWQAGPC